MSVFWRLRTQTVVGPAPLGDAVAIPAAPADTPVTTAPSSSRGSSEWLIILGLSLAVLVLHLATNGLYGFHRDELYYLDSARHLAWGFVDYPRSLRRLRG